MQNLSEQFIEPLLDPSSDRLQLFPIKHSELYQHYLRQVEMFWVPGEAVFTSQDRTDFDRLTADEQHFIKMVLAFFACSDSIVMENLAMRFYGECQCPELRMCYAVQIFMESIHSQSYAEQIDTYVTDQEEKNKLFNAINEYPIIQKKADWCFKWIKSSDSFAERLVAFACVEGIHFCSSFAAIYYMRKRGLLPFLTFLNDLIQRDERLHITTACLTYKLLQRKLSQERIYEIVKDATELEIEFATHSLPCSIIGMNSELMTQHIQSVADKIVESLGYQKIYNVETPFEFMNMLDMNGKTNFFERKVSEYVKVLKKKEDNIFTLDADF